MLQPSLVHISEVDAYPLVVLGLGHHHRVSQPCGVEHFPDKPNLLEPSDLGAYKLLSSRACQRTSCVTTSAKAHCHVVLGHLPRDPEEI